MLRSLIIALYLVVALALEVAVLPQFRMLAPGWLSNLFDLRFLALGGILIGILRGEIPGTIVAVIAAALMGFSQPPGMLGASIVSFTTAAFLGGMLARRVRLQGGVSLWFHISLLLVIERFVWCLIRRFFWTDTPMNIPWLAVFVAAAIGAILTKTVLARLKINLLMPEGL